MTDSIDERLDDLIKAFDELLGRCSESKNDENISILDKLAHYGLTLKEAKAWLNNEPNYAADEKKHLFRTDDKETEPLFAVISST